MKHTASITTLEKLAEQGGDNERDWAMRLLALSSLFYAGLRFHDPNRARQALIRIQQMVAPQEPNHPRLVIRRAWAEVQGGDVQEARRLAETVQDNPDANLRLNCTQVFQAIGEDHTAKRILAGLPGEFVARSNPLGSATARVP